jgi:hypothetical protein
VNLVPTLEKWRASAVGSDFWANHVSAQDALDTQCQVLLDEQCALPESVGPFKWEAAEYHRQFMHSTLSAAFGRRHANSVTPKVFK